MRIEIETDEDGYDCETCGYSYATGGRVFVDGKLILEKPAKAHCFGGQSYSTDELLVLALRKLGHEVLEDGYPYFISQVDE